MKLERCRSIECRYSDKTFICLFSIGATLFLLSYLWANFFNRQAFNIDMYADAQVASMMWEQKTLFPEGWIFGNQYYVVATPVLAAIIYGICGDNILAIGAASSLMMCFELAAFLWMVKPVVSKIGAAAGGFAFIGATLTGTSVCNCTSGSQLFFTMASYYACYMLGILLAMGIWIRLSEKQPVSKVMISISLLFCVGLGLQSLRATLVLAIPLIVLELLQLLKNGKLAEKKRLMYTAALAVSNCLGVFFARFIPAESGKSISGFAPPHSLAEVLNNAVGCFWDFIGITSLNSYKNGVKWLPLTLVVIAILAVSLLAVCRVIYRALRYKTARETDTRLCSLILFCFLSLGAVFCVGVFLGFSLRPIYYFVWFLLAALSFTYIIENTQRAVLKKGLLLLLLGCGAMNLFYNMYPDIAQNREQKELLYGIAEKLSAQGVNCIYVEYTPYYSSAIAACSNGEIESVPVMVSYDEQTGYCFKAFPFLIKKELVEQKEKYSSVLVLTEAYISGSSSFDTLKANPGSEEELMPKLELMSEESNQYFDFYIYRILDLDMIRR